MELKGGGGGEGVGGGVKLNEAVELRGFGINVLSQGVGRGGVWAGRDISVRSSGFWWGGGRVEGIRVRGV